MLSRSALNQYLSLITILPVLNLSGTFHILIADDDADDRLIIREAIKDVSNSIVISEVSNGKELVELMKKQHEQSSRPQAIILDINMPLMDGTDALRLL